MRERRYAMPSATCTARRDYIRLQNVNDPAHPPITEVLMDIHKFHNGPRHMPLSRALPPQGQRALNRAGKGARSREKKTDVTLHPPRRL